jgi:hypothetical protein
MAAVRLRLTPGYERQLLRSAQLLAGLRLAAERVADEAVRIAPREAALPEGRRRHYADMIDATSGFDGQGLPLGRVNALHFTSNFIEFGTVDTAPHAPLRRALDGSQGRAL